MTSFLLDFLPLLAFYAAFWFGGIYVATTAGIVASAMTIAWALGRGHKVRPMVWVSFVLVVVFGGATLVLHDELFIKLKPTVLYACFCLALLIMPRVFKKNPLQLLLNRELKLPEIVWQRMNDSWAGFFAVLALLNIIIAYQFDTATWATFKVFGTLVLMVIFVIIQGVWLAPWLKRPEE
jgi:intracellular septation protein